MPRIAFLLALAISVVGVAEQNKPAGPPPGRLVEVGARSLHIRCVGPEKAGPTVILEAGAGDYSNRWSAVQDLLAPHLRTCAYDRAGFGWSTGTRNESMSQDNDDLRALLKAADIVAPYVLVGHSDGRAARSALCQPISRCRRRRYGARRTHPRNTRLFSTRDNQWQRVREQPGPFGAGFQELYLARQANPTPLGDRPLIVVVGTRPDPKVTTPEEIAREKAAEIEEQPRISRHSKLVRDPASGHHIHVDNPKLVSNAIAEVVTAAVKRTKLTSQ